MNDKPKQRNIVAENWPIIAFAIGLAITWGTLQNRQANAEKRLDTVETKQTAIDLTNTEIRVQLGSIQNDLQWIKTALSNKNK